MNKWLRHYFNEYMDNFISKYSAKECLAFMLGIFFVLERFDRGTKREDLTEFYLSFKTKLKKKGIDV